MLQDRVCCITFKSYEDIRNPVAFKNALDHPYEADALAAWLQVKRIVPHSNLPCEWQKTPMEILEPLGPNKHETVKYFENLRNVNIMEKARITAAIIGLNLLFEFTAIVLRQSCFVLPIFHVPILSMVFLSCWIVKHYPVHGRYVVAMFFMEHVIFMPIAYLLGIFGPNAHALDLLRLMNLTLIVVKTCMDFLSESGVAIQ